MTDGNEFEQSGERQRALDAAIARGIADADAGRVKPARNVAQRLAAKYAGMADATHDIDAILSSE